MYPDVDQLVSTSTDMSESVKPSNRGRSHLGDEGRVQVSQGGLMLLGSVCLLLHLDSPLRTYHRATLRLVEEGLKIRMQGRALGGDPGTKGDVNGDTGSPKSNVQEGRPDL